MSQDAKNFQLNALLLLAISKLKTISGGSDPAGRWLDSSGTECSEDEDGARWEKFTLEEQNSWLESIAFDCQNALDRITQMAVASGVEVPAEILSALSDEEDDGVSNYPVQGCQS